MLDDVYRTEARFLQHLQTQAANIEQFQSEAGADATDITEIIRDAAAFGWLIPFCNTAAGFKETAFGIKRQFFSLLTDPPVGNFADAPDIESPVLIVAGAVKRSRERDQRFLQSKKITQAARIALDLGAADAETRPPTSVKPSIEVFAAAGNYEFALVVTNRADSDMYEVQIRRANSETWETVKSATGKSVNVRVTPTAAGKAEQLQTRVRLIKKNDPYGEPSNPSYVTVSP